MKFVIVGCKGKLGGRVFEVARKKHEIIGIDKEQDIFKLVISDYDAILDVSTPENSIHTLQYAKYYHIPLVIGCTGHTDKQINQIINSENNIPIVLCANFSVGITALKGALKHILNFNFTDAYITEVHHTEKTDSPSGTAKIFEQFIKNSKTKLHPTTSIRQNKIVGEHTITLFLGNEHITITHTAESRDCFADGAIYALEHIVNKQSGVYDLQDLI